MKIEDQKIVRMKQPLPERPPKNKSPEVVREAAHKKTTTAGLSRGARVANQLKKMKKRRETTRLWDSAVTLTNFAESGQSFYAQSIVCAVAKYVPQDNIEDVLNGYTSLET